MTATNTPAQGKRAAAKEQATRKRAPRKPKLTVVDVSGDNLAETPPTEVVVDQLGVVPPDGEFFDADNPTGLSDEDVAADLAEVPLTDEQCRDLDPEWAGIADDGSAVQTPAKAINWSGDDEIVLTDEQVNAVTSPSTTVCPTCGHATRQPRVKITECRECGKTETPRGGPLRIVRGMCPTCYARDRRYTANPDQARAPRSILTETNVVEILAKRQAGMAVRVLAEQYGVAGPTVRAILHGRTWKSVPRPTPVG